MKYVEFYKLQNDGTQKVVAMCQLHDDGLIRCDGDETFINNLEKNGVQDYVDKTKMLFFKDGLQFLEALRYNFTSGYLNASDIMEK